MSGSLTFGYLYDFRNPEPWKREPSALYADILDTIVETERLGFDGAWIPEHHLADDGYMPSPLIALAAVAARTKKIRIGTGIALGPIYDPLRFAEDAAILDILAGGRLELGLAIGYRKREYAAHGLDFGKRGARFDEFLALVRRLWAGETVTHEGRFFNLEGAKVEPRSPRGQIPLFIGGFAPKALERVARYGDGYFGNEEVCDAYLAALAAEGKDPAMARIWLQALMLVVAHDKEAAMEELAPYYLHINNAYGAWMAEDKAIGLDAPAMKPMDLDTFKRSGILQILTPDEAIEHFRTLRSRVPVEHVMMTMSPGLPTERFLAYAGTFAREVLPAFA